MNNCRISDLNPELTALEFKQFRASVILIWPYSSSQRQFALLLAEPNFRLRRKKGQVRARFAGPSAKAIATTGVGIGDEVVLSLQGANFVKESTVQTPGRSIDWELEYAQSMVIQVFRNGIQIANLELVNVAHTPTPGSPSHRVSLGGPTPSQQWSSPAVLKRLRYSDGPIFGAPYDPFTDDAAHGHDKKRRRKSYRDHWKTWTYSARTPSPEIERAADEDLEDTEDEQMSPIRMQQLPHTPLSPLNPNAITPATDQIERLEVEEEQQSARIQNSHVGIEVDYMAGQHPEHNIEYHELYAGPDEVPIDGSQYVFGGDTELDTGINTEEEDTGHDETKGVSFITTVADTEKDEDDQLCRTKSAGVSVMDNTTNELPRFMELGRTTAAQTMADSNGPQIHIPPEESRHEISSANMRIEMPPPNLPILPIEDEAPTIPEILTPIGQEPSSPTLKPLDSSTLPLPSPFPGDIDTGLTSYQDYFLSNQDATVPETSVYEEQTLPRDADYIMDTSFFSSIGSSRASALHTNHESAFTPVRFTFGLDGAGWSRPLDLSSPTPDDTEVQETPQVDVQESFVQQNEPISVIDEQIPSPPQLHTADDEAQPEVKEATGKLPVDVTVFQEPSVIEVSSGSESVENDQNISEDEMGSNLADAGLQITDEEIGQSDDQHHKTNEILVGTQDTGLESTIVDLGSPSSDGTQEADNQSIPPFIGLDETSIEEDIDMRSKQTTLALEEQSHTSHALSPLLLREIRSQTAVDEFDHYTQDVFRFEDTSPHDESLTHGDELHYPDIKMESVEDDSIFEQLAQLTQEERPKTPEGSPEELVIAVPEAGGKMGELHTIAVPATGPARNTRSKLSMTVSPLRAQTHTPRNLTRSTRSNASATRGTLSPVETRTRAAFSTSQEPSHVSPYSLRSQKKPFSPSRDTFGFTAAGSNPSRRKISPRNNETLFLHERPSQVDDHLVDMGIFDSSYDPSASQGRFSNVTYVRDSEDDSVRSEHSISTAYQTDGQIGLHSDPVHHTDSTDDLKRSRAPPASAPEPKAASWTSNITGHALPRGLRSSSPIQPTSPPRQSKGSASLAAHVELSPEPLEQLYESENQHTPRAFEYPVGVLFGGGESDRTPIQETSQTQRHVDLDENMHSSPPATITPVIPSPTHHSDIGRHQMITPEDTQQSITYSYPNLKALHQENSSLITPEPTQATFTSHQSFQADNATDMDETAVQRSSDASPDAADSKPSIGLSTPLAYYTPLRDLSFFLNRSSQYHSADNPDILALVTSDSTSPSRAKKGPKHYFTTLHIADLSSFPHITTVNVFRPYEKALPVAHKGDVVLLRAFAVKSAKRQPGLISAEDSAWCVWRWGKPCWGKKKGAFGEIRAREEVRGPEVERGEGEWKEVERLREWYTEVVEDELRKMVEKKGVVEDVGESSQVVMMGDHADGENIEEDGESAVVAKGQAVEGSRA